MNIQRGDVLKARFPHASGGRGKKRPVVVVQADDYNQRLRHAVVAQVTTNLDEKDDPAYLFIEASSPTTKGTGLDRDCLVCCMLLALMTEDRLQEKIGTLSSELLTELNVPLTVLVSEVTMPTAAMTINPSITAYSTAVGPSSLARNRRMTRAARDMVRVPVQSET